MKNLAKMFWTALLGMAMVASNGLFGAEASTCSLIDLKLSSLIGARPVTDSVCLGNLVGGIAFDLDALVLDGLVGNLLDGLLGGAIRKVVTHPVPVSLLSVDAMISFQLCGLASADLMLQYREHGTTNWITLWTTAELHLLGHPLDAMIDVNIPVPAGLTKDSEFRFLQVLPQPLLGLDLDLDLDLSLLNFWTLANLRICVDLPVIAPPVCEVPAISADLVLDVDASVGSLGAIADAVLCGVAGTPKDITFEVSGAVGSLVSIDLDLHLKHHFLGDLVMTLISPGNVVQHVIFHRPSTLSLAVGLEVSLDGHYIFSDCHTPSLLSLFAAANLHLKSLLPSGVYHTSDEDGQITLMLDAFARLTTDQINGVWTLRIEDYCRMYSGLVLGAHLKLGLL